MVGAKNVKIEAPVTVTLEFLSYRAHPLDRPLLFACGLPQKIFALLSSFVLRQMPDSSVRTAQYRRRLYCESRIIIR